MTSKAFDLLQPNINSTPPSPFFFFFFVAKNQFVSFFFLVFHYLHNSMAVTSADTDFSYRLTESILSRSANNSPLPSRDAHDQTTTTTPRLVAPLPSNSIVIQPKDSDSSFNKYIGDHFKEDAPVLLDRLSVGSPTTNPSSSTTLKKSDSTFWAYLSNDLDNRPLPPKPSSSDVALSVDQQSGNAKDIESQNTWCEYDSLFAGQPTCLFATTTHFFSLGAFLFLFGFICPPLWWVGSFYPARVDGIADYQKRHQSDIKMLRRWRTLNRFFSLGFSTLLIIAIIVLTVLYSKT